MFVLKKSYFRIIFAAILLSAALIAGSAAHSYADKGDLVSASAAKASPQLIEITLGKGEVLTIKGEAADVLVANPSIADVSALQSNKLYIVGTTLGDTNLVVVDSRGEVIDRYDIHVKVDEVAIQNYLNEIYPEENVKVKALTDQVVLTGTVSNPVTANKIMQVVGAYMGEIQNLEMEVDRIIVNLMQVRGEQQVMLKVRIFEASKSLLKELALETEFSDLGDSAGNFGQSFLDAVNGTGLTTTPYAVGGVVFEGTNFGPMSLFLSALENDTNVRTLAEPNLTAISGEQAGFLAGGEFPIPGGRDSEGNVVIEYRSFGVSLNFRPTVLSENRISLNLQTEVSSIARDESLTIAGLDVPGLNIRRASTTVEVPSGGGMMIAGLLESNAVKGMSGLPGVRDVPVLGDLVSSRSFNRDESELVILITAYLVKPYADNHASNADLPEKPRERTYPEDAPAPKVKAQPVGGVDKSSLSKPEQTVRESHSGYLADAFATNIRRIYGRRAPMLLDQGKSFGYLTH